jgi:hypothetical protein
MKTRILDVHEWSKKYPHYEGFWLWKPRKNSNEKDHEVLRVVKGQPGGLYISSFALGSVADFEDLGGWFRPLHLVRAWI